MTTILRYSMPALAAMLLSGISHAEPIRYDQIPDRIAPFGTLLQYPGIKITTLDGKQHAARKMILGGAQIQLLDRNEVPEVFARDQITRIEIGRGRRYARHLAGSAALPFVAAIPCSALDVVGGSLCAVGVVALFSPVWAFTAALAPFYLASEGISFLLPPKIYEIIP